MRRLVLPFALAILATPISSSAASPCEITAGNHLTGVIVVCDAAGHGVVLVAGDHQTAECPRDDGNIVLIVGDHNHVHCHPTQRNGEGAACQGEAYAVEVMGEAESCGVSVVLLGRGSGRLVIVGVGKAEGGTVAVVGDGCATQNEEGVAVGVLSNSCGDSIVPPAGANKR